MLKAVCFSLFVVAVRARCDSNACALLLAFGISFCHGLGRAGGSCVPAFFMLMRAPSSYFDGYSLCVALCGVSPELLLARVVPRSCVARVFPPTMATFFTLT